MITVLLLLSILASAAAEECEFVQKLKERKLKMTLDGDGLHRMLHISIHLSATERLTACSVLYALTLPAGMYVDSDSVNASLRHHSVHSRHYFDVEAPTHKSKAVQVSIYSHKVHRKNFNVDDKLTLPVHVRYQAAGASGVSLLPFPRVLLDCPDDFSSFARCPLARSKSVAHSALRLLPIPISTPPPIRVTIPTGNVNLLYFVVVITTSSLIGTILWATIPYECLVFHFNQLNAFMT